MTPWDDGSISIIPINPGPTPGLTLSVEGLEGNALEITVANIPPDQVVHLRWSEDGQFFRAFSLNQDVTLSAYFQSMLSYFSIEETPPESLLSLKLKELILSILLTDKNAELASYFNSLPGSGAPGIREIMEANYCFNLSVVDFAKLCHRSLSTFKRDFLSTFNDSPGRWLLRKRLDYAAVLIGNPTLQITQIALQCGFEELSHFSRSFKGNFGASPAQFRKDLSKTR